MKSLKLSAYVLGATLIMASCAKKPNSDEAQVSEAKAVKQEVAATPYTLNNETSQVSWVGTKPSGHHNGTIGIENGSLSVKDGKIVGGTITMDMNDIEVLDLEGEWKEKLTGHLKAGDFFDVENHPTAQFTITDVKKLEAPVAMAKTATEEDAKEATDENEYKIENPTHEVTGNLTLRGKTLSITFPAKVNVEEGNVKAEAKFNINRTDWGITYKEESSAASIGKDKIIYDVVNVGFDISATPAEATTEVVSQK